MDILTWNRRRCLIALVFSILLVSMVFFGTSIELLRDIGESQTAQAGWGAYRYFTVLSNIFMAACTMVCLPYQIDGLRNNNYHLPRWASYLFYVGAVGVAITFFVVMFAMWPTKGFYKSYIRDAAPLLHVACPLLGIGMTCFVNNDHRIPFRISFLATLPMSCYAVVYLIAAIFIGKENGGWIDFYNFNKYIPWPFTALLVFCLSYGLALLLRVLHNLFHQKHKEQIRRYYQDADAFCCADIESAVQLLALKANLPKDPRSDLIVPRRLLLLLEDKYKSGRSVEELCKLYIEVYLERERTQC